MLVNVVLQKIENSMAARDLNQSALSEATGIPQSTLSRALSQPVRVTKTHRKICKYLGILIPPDENSSGAQALHKAVQDAWDGTDRHALALAGLLRAAAHVFAVTSASSKSS
jgi:DNA-binding Xre family transcriptional regulator